MKDDEACPPKPWRRREPRAMNYFRQSMMVVFTLIVAAGVLGFGGSVRAATIAGVSQSNISHGDFVTISGNDFGTKSTAAPLKWETFEDGTVGQQVSTTGFWEQETGDDTTFAATRNRHQFSTKNVYHNLVYGVSNKIFRGHFPEWKTTRRAFVSVWTNYNFPYNSGTGYDGQWQFKGTSLQQGTSHISAPLLGQMTWIDSGDQSTSRSNYFVGYDSYNSQMGGDATGEGSIPNIMENNWLNIQIQYQESSAGVSNANISVCQTSTPLSSIYSCQVWGNVMTTHDDSQMMEYLKLGYVLANGGDTGQTWFDDIYVDNSWARVAIGDASTYDFCTHREIQIPTAWSDNSITFTANQGSFQDGDSAYLFVVDENGNTSNGYPITFGTTLFGDLTGDSLINIQDIQACVNHILGTQDWGDAADVNEDAAVNVLDVQAIVNIVLGV